MCDATEKLPTADEALKMSPLPDQCECPECGGAMELNHDVVGAHYRCLAEKGEYDCGIVEVD